MSETIETPEDEITSTDEVVKTDKVFSQEQVNKLVQERLQREKSTSKKIQDDLTAETENLRSQIESYEKLFKSFVEEKKKDIPDSYKALLDKLPLLEQYDFLNNPANKIAEKKQIPATPKPSDKPEVQEKKNKRLF